VALILVVEDDLSVQRALTRVLEGAGHTVRVAPDGRVGLKLFREISPELVVTDIQMPDVNGIEVILMIRAAAPTVPIIAMSGGARSESLGLLGNAQLLGAVALISKPFPRAELLAAVSAALLGRAGGEAGGGGVA
jgi:DNA-binding response OmpR family regulator